MAGRLPKKPDPAFISTAISGGARDRAPGANNIFALPPTKSAELE